MNRILPVFLLALLKKQGSGFIVVGMKNEIPRELEEAHGARFEGCFETQNEAEAEKQKLESRAKL
jgi:hypothetical protein